MTFYCSGIANESVTQCQGQKDVPELMSQPVDLSAIKKDFAKSNLFNKINKMCAG